MSVPELKGVIIMVMSIFYNQFIKLKLATDQK